MQMKTNIRRQIKSCLTSGGGYNRQKDRPVSDSRALREQDDQTIISTIGMAELPLIIDVLYDKYHGKYQLIDIGGDCMFRFGETNVANVSYLATYIHFIQIENNVLRIEGNVSWPAVLKEHFKFYVVVNGREYACTMSDAGLNLAHGDSGRVYEARTAFLYEQRLDEGESCQIAFCYECAGIRCRSGKINSMRFSPVADVLENQYALCGGWLLREEGSLISVRKISEGEAALCERRFRGSFAPRLGEDAIRRVTAVRDGYFQRKAGQGKAVWLFMDRIDKADDNGEAFFEYVCGRKPENVECYFVIDRASPDYERLSRVGNVVDALSTEHCVLLLLAEYIFTSQLNGWVENPYGELEEYFRDLCHRAKVVFLQHGVTKDDQTKWLNRYYQNLHAVVCSASLEKKAFLAEPYFYEERQLWNTGMPRLDRLYDRSEDFILFMPTWRRVLMEQRWDGEKGIYRWHLREGFGQSSYYRFYHEVLNDRKFLRRCREAGYRVIFMPHPIMQPYIGEFRPAEEVLVLPYHTSWRELIAKSRIMVTDYSSAAFDFAYLKKPVVYCQFDREEFFASHTYKRGYFDYETMGFGEIVATKREFLQVIFDYLDNGCREKDRYRERVEAFYSWTDKRCCERIYGRVMEERNGI